MTEMDEKLKILRGYLRSQQFVVNAHAHLTKNPNEVAEPLCVDGVVGRRVIQGFFDSLATFQLLSEYGA